MFLKYHRDVGDSKTEGSGRFSGRHPGRIKTPVAEFEFRKVPEGSRRSPELSTSFENIKTSEKTIINKDLGNLTDSGDVSAEEGTFVQYAKSYQKVLGGDWPKGDSPIDPEKVNLKDLAGTPKLKKISISLYLLGTVPRDPPDGEILPAGRQGRRGRTRQSNTGVTQWT